MATQRLTTSESVMLDIVRASAAGLVAFGHVTQHYFSTGIPDLTSYARGAVGVFFVLSGFVIRYVTTGRPTTFGHYFGDRASRIYSIAVPALLLTVLTDTVALHVNPSFYHYWYIDYVHPWRRVIMNLAFCGHFWNYIRYPMSNNPYWSVDFEVTYYLIYGFWFYLTGIKRWIGVLAVGLIKGPEIMYLFPLWIAGCVIHDLYQKWVASPPWSRTRVSICAGCLSSVALAVFARFHVPAKTMHGFTHFIYSIHLRPTEYLFGVMWATIFFALLLLARQISLQPRTRFVRTVTFLSEGTFPTYLLHFPIYVLIAACIPYDHAKLLPKVLMFLFVVTIGILAGHPGNIFKNKLRGLPETVRRYRAGKTPPVGTNA